jgi:hypothetical protein
MDVLCQVKARNVVILAPNPAAEKLRVFEIAQTAFSLSARFYIFSGLWLRTGCLMGGQRVFTILMGETKTDRTGG